jgi:type I restriction enzyme S subunit
MRSSWRECALGDLARIKHGYAFKGEFFGSTGTHVVLTPGNFHEAGGFKEKAEKAKWYSGPVPEDYVLDAGDLIVAMTEQGEGLLGSSALVPRPGFYLHNQRLGLVTPSSAAVADRRFLYYLFNSRSVRQQIRASANGAKIRHTSPARIYEVKVRVPDTATQRRIASILADYDDLIENNTRRIAILEEMARRIYEEWFVSYRFPGHERVRMVKSELGLVPEGWRVVEVQKVVRRLPAGTVYKQADVVEAGSVPVVDQSSAELLGFHSNEPAHRATPGSPVVIFGDHTCKMQLMVVPFSLGPNTVPFVAERLPVHYVYGLVRGLVSTHEYKRHWSDLMKKKVLVSADDLAESYATLVQPMAELIECLRQATRNLCATRDLLLPKLISGDLDVSALPEPEAVAA